MLNYSQSLEFHYEGGRVVLVDRLTFVQMPIV